MSVDHIRYDLLTQDALRSVIRTVLADAAVKGLPGEHHFFITFDTRSDGVRMSARLRASYPDDMTIVLQHQFWDLIVGEDEFEVGLAFNGVRERLHVPLKAVKAFFDPSVQFGLQFTVEADAGTAERSAVVKTGPAANTRKTRQKKDEPAKEPTPQPAAGKPAEAPAKPAPVPAKGQTSGEVVRLDRFRKK